jgi:outer membrane protein assembly factor BamB
LVDGDQLVICPGGPKGLLAGLDKKKGTVLWRSKDVREQCTYSTPALATLGGVKLCVALTQRGVVGISVKNGEFLWEHKRADPYPDVVCPTPIVAGDLVYVTVGHGGGCTGLKVAAAGKKFKATEVYQESAIGNRQGGVVLISKHVYGAHEDRNWACQELETGQIAWPKRRTKQGVKAGGVLAADGRLYVLDESGVVAMLDASPKAFKVISQFPLPAKSKLMKPRGGIWTHPSLSDGKLYLRDQELVFCYKVK